MSFVNPNAGDCKERTGQIWERFKDTLLYFGGMRVGMMANWME